MEKASPQPGTSAQARAEADMMNESNQEERQQQKNASFETVQNAIDHPHVDTMPEEIWLGIFDLVENVDKVSCLQAHSTWRHYMMNKRTLILFPEVLALIRNRLQRKDLLRLRGVCKKWKDDFDSTSWPFHSTNVTKFNVPAEIDRFLEEMNPNHSNPFPERCVSLNHRLIPMRDGIEEDNFWGTLDRSRREYWEKVNVLLNKFGKHIWNVYIHPNELFDNHELGLIQTMEQCTRNCLIRMPQLKRLTIYRPTEVDNEPDIEEISNRIKSFFNANPLPKLANLEELALSPAVPKDVVERILWSCSVAENVKQLDLGNGFHEPIYTFPNLEILEAQVYIEDLERFQILNPPLRKIILKVQSKTQDEPIDFERLFSIFNQFGRTLTHVEIEGIPLLRMSAVNTFRIQLPKLECLQLKEYDGPLDPFIGLNKLTHFTILNDEVESPSMQGSLVDFEGFEKRIKESNIWTLLPCLYWFEYKMTTPNGRFKYTCNHCRN